eukprot:11046109-Karenia_brevis.AAC.1
MSLGPHGGPIGPPSAGANSSGSGSRSSKNKRGNSDSSNLSDNKGMSMSKSNREICRLEQEQKNAAGGRGQSPIF